METNISLDLIKKSLNDLESLKELKTNLSNDKIIEFSKKIEYLLTILFMEKPISFHVLTRNIIFFEKYVTMKEGIQFKRNSCTKINQESSILNFIIPFIKIFIEKKKHMHIRKIFLILMKICTGKIWPYKLYALIIELILNILKSLLKSNKDDFFNVNDEPFNIINDIIIALISYPYEIKIENDNTYILTDTINLFDKYFFSQSYDNIILTETDIWLKLLEIKFFVPVNQSETSNNINDNYVNKTIEIQTKLYSFLVKIYKFSMRYEYMENIIMKNSLMDLQYYLNALKFLNHLFFEEIKNIPLYHFKIREGIFIPKNKYLFFEDIRPKSKSKEISIIFSFKIFQLEVNKIIDILEIFDNKKKSILKLYIGEKGVLIFEQNENIKLETVTKIQEKYCYFLCITFLKSSEINLFLDGEDKIYITKINNIDLSKEFSLALGKNNFFGVVGELVIINKAITKNKINNLFNLKEDYANNLRKINYDFKMFPKRIILKYKMDYSISSEIKKSKEVLKQLGFEIIFDIHPNDIFYSKTKTKYLDINNNDNRIINNAKKSNNINTPEKSEINRKDIRNIKLFKNISKMNYSYDIFYQSYGIDFITFQLYNIFSKIKDNELLNFYLHEILSFLIKFFSFNESKFEKSRLENEIVIFF